MGPTSIAFVSQAAVDKGALDGGWVGFWARVVIIIKRSSEPDCLYYMSLFDRTGLGLTKRVEAVRTTRGIGKKDMRLNDALPTIKVHDS